MAGPSDGSGASAPNTHVLVIAGGSGTRFWPRSRQGRPKQLLRLWDDKTLLEHTLSRFFSGRESIKLGKAASSHVWVVTTRSLTEPSKQEVSSDVPMEKVAFLGEPVGKNTAACILWGTLEVFRKDPDAVVCVIPADHYIGDVGVFQKALSDGADFVRGFPGILTLGIRPNRPETGYGYIQTGDKIDGSYSKVAKFVEKPELKDALAYVRSGKYLWNAGIFLYRARVGVEAFERCMPDLFELFNSGKNIDEIYENIKPRDALSFDYGVMEIAEEKGTPVAVAPVSFEWNDLGSYTALEEIDKAVVGDVVSHNSASNIVQTDGGLVALLGVNDLVVVKDGDIVLVAAKDRCQEIRKLVDRVRKDYPSQA